VKGGSLDFTPGPVLGREAGREKQEGNVDLKGGDNKDGRDRGGGIVATWVEGTGGLVKNQNDSQGPRRRKSVDILVAGEDRGKRVGNGAQIHIVNPRAKFPDRAVDKEK